VVTLLIGMMGMMSRMHATRRTRTASPAQFSD
jgi:hypothetical protein